MNKKSASKETIAVTEKSTATAETGGNIGEMMAKLINPGELELQFRKGTPEKEVLYMRPLAYLDRVVMDTHLEYIRRETGDGKVDALGEAQALLVTQMVCIAYLTTYKKTKEGRFIRRCADIESAAKFFTPTESAELHKLYTKYFTQSRAEKKE